MSPTSPGVSPTRPAPRGAIVGGCGVAGAASPSDPVRLLEPEQPRQEDQ